MRTTIIILLSFIVGITMTPEMSKAQESLTPKDMVYVGHGSSVMGIDKEQPADGPAKPIWIGGTETYVDRLTVGEKRVVRDGSWIAPAGPSGALTGSGITLSITVMESDLDSVASMPPRHRLIERSGTPMSRPWWRWDESAIRKLSRPWSRDCPLMRRTSSSPS